MSGSYFTSPNFTINFQHTGLYLVAYRIFNATVPLNNTSSLDTIGKTWFGYDTSEVNTSNRKLLSLTKQALSPTSTVPMFPNQAVPDVTLIPTADSDVFVDPEGSIPPTLNDYMGSLHALVKIETRNPGTNFADLSSVDGTVGSSLQINGLPVTINDLYTPSTGVFYRVGSAIGTGAFANFSNNNVTELGSGNVAQILFTFPAYETQTQEMVDYINQITLSLTI